MKNGFLPIGSVILLKGANKKIMVIGYCVMDKNDNSKKYDYCGCLFPEGILDVNKVAVFNFDQIERIFFVGYQDDEEIKFNGLLNDAIKNVDNGIITDNLRNDEDDIKDDKSSN